MFLVQMDISPDNFMAVGLFLFRLCGLSPAGSPVLWTAR